MTNRNTPHTEALLRNFGAELDKYINARVREQTTIYLAKIEQLQKEIEKLRSEQVTQISDTGELRDEELKAIWAYVLKPGIADTKIIPNTAREVEYGNYLRAIDTAIARRLIDKKHGITVAIHVLAVLQNNDTFGGPIVLPIADKVAVKIGANDTDLLKVLTLKPAIIDCAHEQKTVIAGIEARIRKAENKKPEKAAQQKNTKN